MKETISAIGELWKLAACIAVPLCVYLFRRPLERLLSRLWKIKKGDIDIELHEAEEPAVATKKTPEKASPPPEDLIPEPPAADERPFEMQLFEAMMAHDMERAEALLKEQIEQDPDNRTAHEVFFFKLKCDFLRDPEAARKLEAFRTHESYASHRDTILHTLGQFYNATEQYDVALSCFREAGKHADGPADKAYAVAGVARVLTAAGQPEKALPVLQEAIANSDGNEASASLYGQLADTQEALGNQLERALALEKVAELKPTGTNAIFKAAYAQASVALPYLSLHNYLRQLTLDPNSSVARNNYAVQLSELSLRIASVKEYRRAQKDGDTLAMANLAYLYLNAGFSDDAEQLLREAQQQENYHGNVDNAMAKLRTDQTNEDEKIEKLKKSGAAYHRLARKFAEALLLRTPNGVHFGGHWSSSDGQELKITQSGAEFVGEWGDRLHHRKLEGRQINRGARAKLYIEQSGLFSSISEKISYSNPREMLAYLTEDGNTVELFSLGKEEPVFLTLKRKPTEAAEQEN